LAIQLFGALFQIPNVEGEVTCCSMEYMTELWVSTGWMIYPLAFCLVLGVIVIVIKFISLTGKAVKTKQILKDVDELLTQRRIKEAIELTRDTDSPAANILYAGLERHEEGTERVMKAIENQGLLQANRIRHSRSDKVFEALETDRTKHLGNLVATGTEVATWESVTRSKWVSVRIGGRILAHGTQRRSTGDSPLSMSKNFERTARAARRAAFASSRGRFEGQYCTASRVRILRSVVQRHSEQLSHAKKALGTAEHEQSIPALQREIRRWIRMTGRAPFDDEHSAAGSCANIQLAER